MIRVLFTSPILIHPPTGGPQLRVENSLKALNRISEVHVVSRVGRKALGGSEAQAFYERNSARFVYAPSVQSQLPRQLRKIWLRLVDPDSHFILRYLDDHKIDIVWFEFGCVSFPLIRKLKKLRPDIKMVCDTDSVWSQFVLRELPFENDPKRKKSIARAGKQKQREEAQWVNLVEATTAVSEVDAGYYRSLTSNPAKIRMFYNVLDLSNYAPSQDQSFSLTRPAICLSGSFFKNSPMEQAARWMIHEVMPLVRAKMPPAMLYVIGSKSDIFLADIHDKNVTVTGRVPSVLPYLQNCDVATVPLKFESGTRFKILEAGACLTPVVSTTLGAEGLDVVDREHVLIADTSQAFADSIVKLISDKPLARRIAANCRKLVEERYSLQALEQQAKGILEYLSS
jgi:glycosyltransferase involved in cell wall biosynthesis